jgi:predicted acetyltransferase
LLEIRMGQWLGGRSVSNLGLAGVAVAPEARGDRVALELVSESLRAARRAGTAVSTLYPATLALYRAAGYELAGSRFRWTFTAKRLPRADKRSSVEPITGAAIPDVEATYGRVARTRNGYLDRGPYVWNRVRGGRGGETRGYAVREAGELSGYVYLTASGSEEERKLAVKDFIALTKESSLALVRLLGDHQTTMPTTVFYGAAVDPFLFALPETAGQVELAGHWMLRVVDVERALSERGYPALDRAIDLEVTDDVLGENSGRYRLEVSRGRGRVSCSGEGSVRLTVRGLAPLYTGFLPPEDLARAGLLEAGEAELAVLRELFAGPPPAMPDFF